MTTTKAAKDVLTNTTDQFELADALEALANQCHDVAVYDATIIDTARWERNTNQLRFVAVLIRESSMHTALACAWIGAGTRALTAHHATALAALDAVHAERASRRPVAVPAFTITVRA